LIAPFAEKRTDRKEIVMEQIKMIKEAPIFVRIDDIGAGDFPSLQYIIDICKETEIPVMLGVIPGKLSEETTSYLREKINYGGAGLIIAQHGVNHIAHPDSKWKMEFHLMEPVEDITTKLLAGKEVLFAKLGISINWYIPPWNKYGRNLISALEKNGYKAFSAGRNLFQSNVLDNFPVNQDIVISYKTGEIEENLQVWQEKTKKKLIQDGKVGLMLHHHLMKERHISMFRNWAINFRKKAG
jgi:predicted deacetylase